MASSSRSRVIQTFNPLPRLPNHPLLSLSTSLPLRITGRSNRQVKATPQSHLLNWICVRVLRGISGSNQATRFTQDAYPGRDVPMYMIQLETGLHMHIKVILCMKGFKA